ncbi:hypothetical protein [Microbacterium aurum]
MGALLASTGMVRIYQVREHGNSMNFAVHEQGTIVQIDISPGDVVGVAYEVCG